MSFLLDTNVLSECFKPQPSPAVLRWLDQQDEDSIYVSVFSFAEIYNGVASMAPGKKQTALKSWVENELPLRFERRIIGMDLRIAEIWGNLMSRSAKAGHNLGVMDGFFAGTALAFGLTLATRNTAHFEPLQVPCFNPWNA